MNESRNEHTIASSCHVRGRGYWTGRNVTVHMHPAPIGTGVILVRTDLPGTPSCPATIRHARDASFRTNLASGTARFSMVEHLLAALAALEIDNCLVEIDGEELPGLDGSAAAYVDALRHAGLIVQARLRRKLLLKENVRVAMDGRWLEAIPAGHGPSTYEYRLSYDDRTPIAPQRFRTPLTPHHFSRDVASARTFVTEVQARRLRDQGVAGHVTNQDLLVFGEKGLLDNRLRFPDECARHKVLDMIGDLSLVAADIVANFVSFRGGHILNAAMARRLARKIYGDARSPKRDPEDEQQQPRDDTRRHAA